MLLSNLSDGPCETKDVIVENEAMIRKLAELLVYASCSLHILYMVLSHMQQRPHTSVRILIACICVVRHLTRGDCQGKFD